MSEIKRYGPEFKYVGLGEILPTGNLVVCADGDYTDYSTALRLKQERDTLAELVHVAITAHDEKIGRILFGAVYDEAVKALAELNKQSVKE